MSRIQERAGDIVAVSRTSGALVREGIARLGAAGIEHARQEAEWLLGRLLGAKPFELYVEEREVPGPMVDHFFAQLDARARGIPLQYLLGEVEFLGDRLSVGPGVFIPRPETEAVVEAALGPLRAIAARAARPLRLLDLGTGSGCIAVALAKRLPACFVVGLDVSWCAVCIAQRNVRRHGLEAVVRLIQGRWTEALGGTFDGIISNPPYVASAQVDRLPLDVRREPRISLDGGADGLRDLWQLMDQVPRVLAPGGLLVLECAEEHVDVLVRAASAASWVERVSPVQDLAGRPRGILVIRTGQQPH